RYCACFSLADNPIGKEILNRSEALAIEGIAIGDGWLVLHFWEGDALHVRGLITQLAGGSIIIVNFSIAIMLCSLTIQSLQSESTLSASYKRLQFTILRALFAQSAIPIVLVYIPCGVGISLPLF
ncbi:hypothetical protein PENTCL1PPCAC_30162, partial [Pristionchus entomophagus]